MDHSQIQRIALASDFGPGIYVGQILARLSALLPGIPAVDLVHDLPPFRPDLAAYLLPALIRDMPPRTLYLCVVDPGVGGSRAGLAVESDGTWLVGPDNGLLSRVVARGRDVRVWRICWQPEGSSASFHGRDWFAPLAARLLLGQRDGLATISPEAIVGADWEEELPAIVYADAYGNLMTGLRAALYPPDWILSVGGRRIRRARTFCEVDPGDVLWYENALGLIEIAVNQDRADRVLGLVPGDPVGFPLGPETELPSRL